ncbi:endolytic transglycosylase MltG [Sulfuricella sp.]|uniref:endolytic transglycosylase MltG n=1 Tax=Sulfuricella sp. TaxID=2099377 RepID=UPI002C3579AC|nr:endolytic transglycosylase MltG [Sulfuricella sp.]HUX62738.1 endolytic transglycosylase MltG [Sulfuricella sp.]
MMNVIKRGIAALIVLGMSTAGWVLYFANTPVHLPQSPYEFTLKHGSSLRTIAKQFSAEGLIPEPWSFIVLAKILGKEGDIKAGNYQLDRELTPFQLVQKITKGDVSQSEIVFIEGWNFSQMRKALDEHPAIRHDTTGLSDRELLNRLGVQEESAEGLFFPDTYYFSNGMSDLSVLKRAYQIMEQRLADAWRERRPNLPYSTPYEALIMASIVEKETGRSGERPMIAAVFINRLRTGMRLQTDPTVIYGLGETFDGNLHKRDLTTDNAYNTYTRSGLPPGPISMPGWASLNAALHPGATSALYFVSRGDGTHQFSSSLTEHNQAVARYQKTIPRKKIN